MNFRLIHADVIDGLRSLPDASVNCCVTSPPYWGLRSYGTHPRVWDGDSACSHEWGDDVRTPWANDVSGPNGRVKNAQASKKVKFTGPFCQQCGAWRGELGLEPTYQLYISHIVTVFREVRRVLRKDATLWLNIGDCFATGAGKVADCPGGGDQGERFKGYRGTHTAEISGKQGYRMGDGGFTQPNRMPQPGLKPKDLCMIPHRAAIALQDDGWWVRMDNVWSKNNPLPESVTDRTTKSHEYLFLLTKNERYFYDAEVIKERATDTGRANGRNGRVEDPAARPPGSNPRTLKRLDYSNKGRNKRSVWTCSTQGYKGHRAVMPEALAEPCVLAGCPDGGTVIDPFTGSGTVGVVALRQGRNFIGIDLSAKCVQLARNRIRNAAPLLNEEVA